jgi:fucose 4-O-acetylase-like acetyltransferase
VGAVCSILYLKARALGNEKNFMIKISLFGLILIAIGHFYLSPIFPKTYTSIKPHPVFFLERLGYVFLLLSLCWYYISKVNTKGGLVIETGKESLLIYWLHLQIIYRMLWHGESFDSIIKQSFNPWQCLLFTLGLIALMIGVAKIWGPYKRKHKKGAKIVTTIILCGALLIFVVLKNY